MKRKAKRNIGKVLAVLLILVVSIVSLVPVSVSAYGPSTMYTSPSGAPAPGALYARAMQASNGKMYATFEQYTTGVSVFPIFESTNNGQSWSKVGDVRDTHKGVGMRWEPQLYELPQAIGSMPAGTLLCAGLVLPYDRSFCEIDLYKSNDAGRNWSYVSTIAVGKVATPGNDPVWEPFLMVANNKLICYYSDERDSAHSQKLVHQASTDGVNWGSVVNDVALSDSGQRPGMVVVAKMPNGNYIMTYEIVGMGGSWYKISSNPESWNATDKGTCFHTSGSSPYCVNLNGTIVLSSGGNNNLYYNTNNGTGSWTQISSVVGTGYSRCLVPLQNGRLFVICAGWNGSGLNSVTYGDMSVPTVSTATPTPTPSAATPTPTPTPSTATATPTPSGTTATPVPTATPTPSGSTPAPGGIKVQFFNGNTAASTNTIYPNFKVVNTGTASINLSDVKMRYYFTNDGTQGDSFACDYSTIGAGNVTGSFATIAKTNADRYLEVGFTSGAGTLGAGASAEVKGRTWKSDWSNFTQTNDYSFNATATNYVDATTVTGYIAGALKWGTEP